MVDDKKTRVAPVEVDAPVSPDALDARRYRRLRVLGCALFGSKELERGMVARFTNLDADVDADLILHPSRGEG